MTNRRITTRPALNRRGVSRYSTTSKMNTTTDKTDWVIGEKVICVDATASFHRVTEGAIYTVEKAFDGSPTVICQGSYMSMERFRKMEGRA